jgi:hypothetical protein
MSPSSTSCRPRARERSAASSRSWARRSWLDLLASLVLVQLELDAQLRALGDGLEGAVPDGVRVHEALELREAALQRGHAARSGLRQRQELAAQAHLAHRLQGNEPGEQHRPEERAQRAGGPLAHFLDLEAQVADEPRGVLAPGVELQHLAQPSDRLVVAPLAHQLARALEVALDEVLHHALPAHELAEVALQGLLSREVLLHQLEHRHGALGVRQTLEARRQTARRRERRQPQPLGQLRVRQADDHERLEHLGLRAVATGDRRQHLDALLRRARIHARHFRDARLQVLAWIGRASPAHR